MNLIENPQLLEIKASVIEGMVDFMDEDTAYSQSDIDECGQILTSHLTALSSCEDQSNSLEVVKETVIRLNALNDKADCELIETDQREQICEFIIQAGFLKGFNRSDEDITEDWREWWINQTGEQNAAEQPATRL